MFAYRQVCTILGLMAAAMATTPAAADVLVLTDGTRLEGRVEPANNAGRVAIVRAMGRMELPQTRISETIEESDAQDYTHIGNQYLGLKDYSPAMKYFNMALEADATHAPAKTGLDQANAALKAIADEAERQRVEKLGQNLDIVPELIKNEAFEKAAEVINRVMDANPTDQQSLLAQKLMRDLYLAWGFARYDRLDYRGAEEKYQRVLEMDPDNVDARDRLLEIWRRDPNKKDEVLKAYEVKLRQDPNNLDYNRIVGEALYDKERFEEAIPLLKKVYGATRFAGLGLNRKLENSYREAVRAREVAEDWPGAIRLFEEMLTQFPNQDQDQLTVLRYQRDRKALANDDFGGWAVLVKRVYDTGLTSYAVREAELVLRYDPTNETALSVIRADAVVRIGDIEAAMKPGTYYVARDLAEAFIRDEGRFADLLDKARELLNRADIEARREAKAQKETAREIAQRGIEYYNEAMRFANQLASNDTKSNQRVISYKSEATVRARRAIDHYNTAIKMDPSLATIQGMDLNTRLRDAQTLLNRLTAPAPYIRQPRNRNN